MNGTHVYDLFLARMAVAMFDYGSEMQLSAALVINVLHLCVHVYAQPFGGPEGRSLNALETGVLVLVTYISFGADTFSRLDSRTTAQTK